MTKDFKWPYKTYYVEVSPTYRLMGTIYINGPTMIPDSSYGDVILTSRGVALQEGFRKARHLDASIAAALTPEEADELVQLLGVKLEAFFRK